MASTDVHACPGVVDETELRKKIVAVHSDTTLSQQEKAKRVQALMLTRWSGPAKENVHPHSNCNSHCQEEVPCKGEIDCAQACCETDAADAALGKEGCEHYKRPVMLLAKCCNKFFWCRFCHDNQSDHKIDRYATEFMKCMYCYKVQPVAEKCNNEECVRHNIPVNYFCGVCKFWDDDKSKNIYHCPHCNLCRIGKGLGIDYFHCMKCRACMPMKRKEHKCVERALESDCPICHEYLFTSTSPVIFAKCGHCMHASCMDAYLRTNYRCPICCKSLGDMTTMFSRIDQKLASEAMPSQYANTKSQIYCADCEEKTVAPYHFIYHKCQSCGSYNTNVLSTFEGESSEGTSAGAVSDGRRSLYAEDDDDDDDDDGMDVDEVGETDPETDGGVPTVSTSNALNPTTPRSGASLVARVVRSLRDSNRSWTQDLSLEDLLALDDLENSQELSQNIQNILASRAPQNDSDDDEDYDEDYDEDL